MTIRYMMFVGLLSLSPLMSAMNSVDKKITEAIKYSDVEIVSKACRARSAIPLNTKKIYARLAREATKRAYMDLESSGFSDIKHVVMGLFKAATAAVLGWYCYKEATKTMDYFCSNTQLYPFLKENFISEVQNGNISRGFINLRHVAAAKPHAFVSSALVAYLGGKSIQDFLSIFSKDERQKDLLRALAVEALVNNIPVLELNN